MLGYSSVEHMGILVLGMGLGSGAVWASLLHAVNNAFAKGLIFLAAGIFIKIFGPKRSNISKGSFTGPPRPENFLIFGLIVITGFPPFGIFYSEFLILREAMITQRYMVVFFIFLFLSVIFFGYADYFRDGFRENRPIMLKKEAKKKIFL